MPTTVEPWRRREIPPFWELVAPIGGVMEHITPRIERKQTVADDL